MERGIEHESRLYYYHPLFKFPDVLNERLYHGRMNYLVYLLEIPLVRKHDFAEFRKAYYALIVKYVFPESPDHFSRKPLVGLV